MVRFIVKELAAAAMPHNLGYTRSLYIPMRARSLHNRQNTGWRREPEVIWLTTCSNRAAANDNFFIR